MNDDLRFNLDAAVPFGLRGTQQASTPQLMDRLRMVLETRPGHLPWQPEFGCDLDELVGEPLTWDNLSLARNRIQGAIEKWLPEIELISAALRVVNEHDLGTGSHRRSLPLAEAAMVPFGVGGKLQVNLEVRTLIGPTALQITLDQ